MDSVGKMQEEALKRKERLKALKEKKGDDNSESKLEGEQLPKYECSRTCMKCVIIGRGRVNLYYGATVVSS